VVLAPGEALFIPSYYFHFIISLDHNVQCNTRSGRDFGITNSKHAKTIQECGFAVSGFTEDGSCGGQGCDEDGVDGGPTPSYEDDDDGGDGSMVESSGSVNDVGDMSDDGSDAWLKWVTKQLNVKRKKRKNEAKIEDDGEVDEGGTWQ
jgi:hypothetical protein